MNVRSTRQPIALLLLASIVCFSSCLTSKKMDKFVAEQYGSQLPKQKPNKKADITVTSTFPADNDISLTTKKTSHVLPLIVYWQYDYRHTCTLNPQIGVASFSNTVNSMSGKIGPKLNGAKLELTVEQVPQAFAIVDKGHIVWVVYAFSWDKIFVQPDAKDLVVSYKLTGNDGNTKTGRITVKNAEHSRNIRFFQSWRSATSEYLTDYNADLASMSKDLMERLMTELSM